MGFWNKLFGRPEYDTTVTDYQEIGIAGSFRLEIEDVFFITGRGTVATGTVASGVLTVGDAVTVRKADGTRLSANVTGIEAFRDVRTSAGQGDVIGVLLDSVSRHDLARGDILEA